MKPIIKYPGGKTQLLPQLKEIITPELLTGHTYYEPFIGGGALCFDLEHSKSVINDLNEELINLYQTVRLAPDRLIRQLQHCLELYKERGADYYYWLRNLDREPDYLNKNSNLYRAARTIFLNKTCFNGLYRVNSKGQFNVPIGRTASGKLPDVIQADAIYALSEFLLHVKIRNRDYKLAVQDAEPGDVLYFDPPYLYDTTGFTAYTKEGFGLDETRELRALCDSLVEKDCKVVISNNDTVEIRKIFTGYNFKEVAAKRSINSDGKNRNNGKEVIIYKI